MTVDTFLKMLEGREGSWCMDADGNIRDGAACPLTCFFNLGAGSYIKAARLLGISCGLRDNIASASDVPCDDASKTVRALRRRLLRTLKLKETET